MTVKISYPKTGDLAMVGERSVLVELVVRALVGILEKLTLKKLQMIIHSRRNRTEGVLQLTYDFDDAAFFIESPMRFCIGY